MTRQAGASAALNSWSEADVEHHVRVILRDLEEVGLRVLCYHTRDSRGSHHGWPDWVLSGPRGVLFRELKRQGGRTTPEQDDWLDSLAGNGLDAGIWRPSDCMSGRVGREIAAIAGAA